MIRLYLLLFFTFYLSGCSNDKKTFTHNLATKGKPWTREPGSKAKDKFTFAIIGDLNSGERAGVFDVAVEQLKLLQPDFIMSVGDLIDGGTEDTTELTTQFNRFDDRINQTGIAFFHVGGNHDLTNLVMRQYWENRYGRRYYHFIYNNALFLILDTEDYSDEKFQQIFKSRARVIELLDSGKREQAEQMDYYKMPERRYGEIGKEQSDFFVKIIKSNPNVSWTFLFMHKPVWQKEGGGNLTSIEAALSTRNYTLFNGHYHTYSYTERNSRDYIMLGTTSGEQDPESKMSFDHIAWITLTDQALSIANLRLEGILGKSGEIPLHGDTLTFQASVKQAGRK